MAGREKELLDILRDESNCNVLDYVDDAADLYEEFIKNGGNIERCNECDDHSLWQWRGVKED